MTAAEILSESKPLLLSRDLMERILIDRLSGDFPGAEPLFQYLIGCYRRAYEEGKKIGSMKDKGLRSEMKSVIRQAKKLAVSYCRIHLGNPDLFPSGDSAKDKKLLLPLIFSGVSTSVDGFGGKTFDLLFWKRSSSATVWTGCQNDCEESLFFSDCCSPTKPGASAWGRKTAFGNSRVGLKREAAAICISSGVLTLAGLSSGAPTDIHALAAVAAAFGSSFLEVVKGNKTCGLTTDGFAVFG